MEVAETATRSVGRQRVLDQVDRQLRGARDVIIISPPISGLSTVLTKIQHHVTTAEHFSGFKALYLNCRQLLRGGDTLASSLRHAVTDEVGLASTIPIEQQEVRLIEFLDQLLDADDGLRMVIVLDDLQLAPEDQIKFLLEQIRAVSEYRQENKSLKRSLFVLGGHCLDLRRLDPNHTSPFNIAEKIYLDDLDEEEALELVHTLLSQSTRPYTELVAKHICYLTRNHPYLLQQVCWHLVHDTVPGTRTAPKTDFKLVEKVVDAIRDDSGDRLLRCVAEALEDLPPSVLKCLCNILNGTRYDAGKDDPALRELARLGLISSSKSPVWEVRNGICDRYLRQHARVGPVLAFGSFMPRRLYANVAGYSILYELENDLRDFIFCKMTEKFPNEWRRKIDERIASLCHA